MTTKNKVIMQLNDISRSSGMANAAFSDKLVSVNGTLVSGFKFQRKSQCTKLASLLTSIGHEYTVHTFGATEYGELHIAPRHTCDAIKLFAGWRSGIVYDVLSNGALQMRDKWAKAR